MEGTHGISNSYHSYVSRTFQDPLYEHLHIHITETFILILPYKYYPPSTDLQILKGISIQCKLCRMKPSINLTQNTFMFH